MMPDPSNSRPISQTEPGTSARVARELIRTPAFREIVKLNLVSMDPGAARDLVRAVMREDLNLSLSALGASPAMINGLVEAVLEFARQIDQFPPDLLEEFLPQTAGQIDTDALRQIPGALAPLVSRALGADPALSQKALEAAVGGFNSLVKAVTSVLASLDKQPLDFSKTPLDGAALGKAVSLSARLINRSLDDNPDFLKQMTANIEFGQVARAALAIGWALAKAMVRTPLRWLRAIITPAASKRD